MENEYFPQAFSFLDAYLQQIKPLAGYAAESDRSGRVMVGGNRRGV